MAGAVQITDKRRHRRNRVAEAALREIDGVIGGLRHLFGNAETVTRWRWLVQHARGYYLHLASSPVGVAHRVHTVTPDGYSVEQAWDVFYGEHEWGPFDGHTMTLIARTLLTPVDIWDDRSVYSQGRVLNVFRAWPIAEVIPAKRDGKPRIRDEYIVHLKHSTGTQAHHWHLRPTGTSEVYE